MSYVLILNFNMNTLKNFYNMTEVLGFRAALAESVMRTKRAPYYIKPNGYDQSLCVRSGSSDISVFHQIFIEKEYSFLSNGTDLTLIIDAGAYVGYSSFYFLNQFPHSHVVAIEPERHNFAQLKTNLRNYRKRTELIRAGLWSHETSLTTQEKLYRDGGYWTHQVRECADFEEPIIRGISINSILDSYPNQRISLLKVDIEGAEAIVFSRGIDSWLPKVDAIVIELHDDSVFGNTSSLFYDALRDHNFLMSSSGELTYCHRQIP